MKKVCFRYASSDQWVLNDISLQIDRGSKVGIVGTTGSGKSTLVDLITGLLSPTKGGLFVDDVPVTSVNSRSWQKNFSYVSQTIFLLDGTIAANIALGESRHTVDMERLKIAAEKAQIRQEIESLKNGYETIIGERGIRLSGGQRQRLALARALYRECQLLVLDEATSALDFRTESLFMKSLSDARTDLTIVIVAHRIHTLSLCDRIIELNQGRINELGSYHQFRSSLLAS